MGPHVEVNIFHCPGFFIVLNSCSNLKVDKNCFMYMLSSKCIFPSTSGPICARKANNRELLKMPIVVFTKIVENLPEAETAGLGVGMIRIRVNLSVLLQTNR